MKCQTHCCKLLLAAVFSLLLYNVSFAQTARHSFELGDSAFLLDGKPFVMISGEMHYTRIPEACWRDRMKMAKAMGLNTIGAYVFWNAHEQTQGKYDFTGNNNIAEFIQIAKEEDLWVVLRPSPYVCAEWEFGGYPWWLLKDSTIKVRSKDARFFTAYTNYVQRLSKELVPLLITHGGNIVMVQIENEYGSYSNDKSYLELNKKIFREAGFDGILFTCDGDDKMHDGYLPGLLPAVNGSDNPAEVKKLINTYHDGKGPYYIAEWYPGWFDQWGKPHAKTDGEKEAKKLDEILSAGISVNIYLFHGGTTRGFMNGANRNVKDPYAPQTASYDYDSPLDESGNPSPKYVMFRNVIAKHLPAGTTLPPIPANKKAITLPVIALTGSAGLFDNLPKPVTAVKPLCFEDLDQAYGFVLYRTAVSSFNTGYLKINGLRDYAVVYVNNQKIGVLDRRLEQDSILLTGITGTATLDILVENNGRINYGPYLTDNRKGILGDVVWNNKSITNWTMYGFPFENAKDIKFTTKPAIGQPALYKGSFTLNETGDTYFDLSSFGKGFVFLNGHNLGKYWQIGPQQTAYVPASWLKKGQNEVIVFDELKDGHTQLTTLSTPILNKLTTEQK
ncbi:putative exported beta-galactosidase [Russula earlei]|uniref:Exported beta-galactosidase n=1 Tax=Russula earlei TaxID=71964 RepID=A0ACC0TYN4_9AGAM|nr:putative exported beta-galactosidase [Russula earlei]